MEAKSVQTLDRTLDIIELLALSREGMGVSEIAQKISLHKSTVHRLLNALAIRGYIEKDATSLQYRLGLKFIEISSLRLNHLELKTEASPTLRAMSETLDQVVHLAILDKAEVVYIEKLEPRTSLRMYSQIGRRIPVYCSALGKALVSDLGADKLRQLADSISYKAFTERTLTSSTDFIHAVEITRQRGWGIDDGEYEIGIRCFGAPIFDYTGRIIAALSTSGTRDKAKNDQDLVTSVTNAARLISRRMGFVGGT